MRAVSLLTWCLAVSLVAGPALAAAPASPAPAASPSSAPWLDTRASVGAAALETTQAHLAFGAGDYKAGKRHLAAAHGALKKAVLQSPPEATRTVLDVLAELAQVEATADRWDKKADPQSRRMADRLMDLYDELPKLWKKP